MSNIIKAPAEDEIRKVCEGIQSLLTEKNRRYGNSALEPLDIFERIINGNDEDIVIKSILIRWADKLKRMKNSTKLRKNDIVDTIGYCILICIRKKWKNFADLID